MINVNKKIENISRLCHEANRVLQKTFVEQVNPPWDALSEDLKDSTYIGVFNALEGKTPEELHVLWMQERIAQGWVWGTELDRDNRVHPNLVEYNELSAQQQMKDHLFAAIVVNYRP